jgi:hypothetical protein
MAQPRAHLYRRVHAILGLRYGLGDRRAVKSFMSFIEYLENEKDKEPSRLPRT